MNGRFGDGDAGEHVGKKDAAARDFPQVIKGQKEGPAAVRPAPRPLLPGLVARLPLHHFSMTTTVFESEK
ncbi:MAG TPA: hypothetical protein VGQ94_02530, partial [Terriglobales bacterium]|nr:hypothetical protein [Terriglobales bacterium]